jgi:hypothetical protein
LTALKIIKKKPVDPYVNSELASAKYVGKLMKIYIDKNSKNEPTLKKKKVIIKGS